MAFTPVLANRMPLDLDGTAMWSVLDTDLGDAPTPLSAGQVKILNNEGPDDLGSTTGEQVSYYLVIFPELRDVVGLHIGIEQGGAFDAIEIQLESSADTTNGYNGTWTLGPRQLIRQANGTRNEYGHTQGGDWRRYAPAAIGGGVTTKAIRVRLYPADPVNMTWFLKSLHVYGRTTPGANPHRLEIWRDYATERLNGAYLDWGQANKPSTEDRDFVVYNLSPTRSARKVTVKIDALTEDTTWPFRRQFLIASTGGTFAPTLLLPEIRPGQNSPTLMIRRITPKNAAEGPWAVRLRAVAESWAEVTT